LWPRRATGERHKPIAILASHAAKAMHLPKDARISEHVHVSMRALLEKLARRLDPVEPLSKAGPAELAALELAICVLELADPDALSQAQQLWERKEWGKK
jgi:hypothetical protein